MNYRGESLLVWSAKHLGLSVDELQQHTTLLAGDASFRKYYRTKIKGLNYILMDAPPDLEPSDGFVAIDRALLVHGLIVPQIYHLDLNLGFLIISDLGDELLFNVLNSENMTEIYGSALKTLVSLQSCKISDYDLPIYDPAMCLRELHWFVEWFLEAYLKLSLSSAQRKLLDQSFALLIDSAMEQPRVFMHRDYHSRNLFALPKNKIGVIDFQGAVWGPITYDAVSLLRDCYLAWPKDFVRKLALSFKTQLKHPDMVGVSDEKFMRWFDWMGLQRHLKATYNFARKHCRDRQSEYLADIPRVLSYIDEVCSVYAELEPLYYFMSEVVRPQWERVS